jgi:hypothetical protein
MATSMFYSNFAELFAIESSLGFNPVVRADHSFPRIYSKAIDASFAPAQSFEIAIVYRAPQPLLFRGTVSTRVHGRPCGIGYTRQQNRGQSRPAAYFILTSTSVLGEKHYEALKVSTNSPLSSKGNV